MLQGIPERQAYRRCGCHCRVGRRERGLVAPTGTYEIADTIETADSLTKADLVWVLLRPTDEPNDPPANAESTDAVPEVVVADELQVEVNESVSEKVVADLAAAATAAVEEEARILAIEVDRVASEQAFFQIAELPSLRKCNLPKTKGSTDRYHRGRADRIRAGLSTDYRR